MLKLIANALMFLILGACQMAPTKIKNEVGGAQPDTVFADTRPSLDYVGFRIPGSVHLNSDDFIILVNPEKRTRKLDPDINQTIERLAKKGINPNKKIVLIADNKNQVSAKKWKWLLNNLTVADVSIVIFDDYVKQNAPLRPAAEPERVVPWTSEAKPNWYLKSDNCFIVFDEKSCS